LLTASRAFLACGSKEGTFFWAGFGSFAAKTSPIKRFSALPQAIPAKSRCDGVSRVIYGSAM